MNTTSISKCHRPSSKLESTTISMLEHPWLVVFFSALVIVGCLSGITKVTKDPSVDAFVPQDHPAAINREKAKDVFGLEDPVIVGLSVPESETVFTPERLSVLRQIDSAVRKIDGVKKNDVISLANQNAIFGENGDLNVEPIIEKGPLTDSLTNLAEDRYAAMPMLEGLLASQDKRLLTIIIPVEDPNHAFTTVEEIKQAALAIAAEEFDVHIAGVAAMNARLSHMVNTDTRIFVPAAVLTVLIFLFIAHRNPAAITGPLLVIAGSAGIAIGIMGWLGAHYYLITTALPVVIMAIAVADCLHISTYYLRAKSDSRDLTPVEGIKYALSKAWLPVSLTSITTIAAFIGLSLGAAMKPISEFGLFAAVGVAAAWLLSLTLLPAIIVLTKLSSSKAHTNKGIASHHIESIVNSMTRSAFDKPIQALFLVVIVTGFMAIFAIQAQFDYERKRYFSDNDTVRIADAEINERLGGINFLDVVVESQAAGGLMTPAALSQIKQLRETISELPNIEKVSGVDEYIALMHEVLTDAPQGQLPDREKAPAQYMFLYEASGAPEDFKQEIDFEHQRALIRAQLNTDSYATTSPIIEVLENSVSEWRISSGLNANISGRVAVNNGWMSQLAKNHFIGLSLALLLVFVSTVVAFRSVRYAILAMIPVLLGIVSVYATMGLFAIDIAPATSMTAAIATGLGIDFGIHLISHIKKRAASGAIGLDAFQGSYDIVARACFYSAVALGVALAVVSFSSAPPLRWFGLLVSVGAFGSLIGALLVVPAIWSVGTLLVRGRQAHAV
ncbi:MAG: MMPL family transporter [Pseudomonadota bacterium]